MAWKRPVIPSAPTTANAVGVRVSASGSNLTTTAQNFYGSPVTITGKRPDLGVDTIRASFVPLAASGSVVYTGAPPSGLTYGGACSVGVCLYAGGERIVFSSGLDYVPIASSNQYSRFLPYGYYGGRYNAAMDGTNLVRGDAAYLWGSGKPDAVGLMVRVTRGVFSFDGRVILIW